VEPQLVRLLVRTHEREPHLAPAILVRDERQLWPDVIAPGAVTRQ
jgi:hypothetical protein